MNWDDPLSTLFKASSTEYSSLSFVAESKCRIKHDSRIVFEQLKLFDQEPNQAISDNSQSRSEQLKCKVIQRLRDQFENNVDWLNLYKMIAEREVVNHHRGCSPLDSGAGQRDMIGENRDIRTWPVGTTLYGNYKPGNILQLMEFVFLRYFCGFALGVAAWLVDIVSSVKSLSVDAEWEPAWSTGEKKDQIRPGLKFMAFSFVSRAFLNTFSWAD